MVRSASHSTGGTRTSTVTITADNAFLPSSVASQFGRIVQWVQHRHRTRWHRRLRRRKALRLGTINTNNYDLNTPLSYGKVCNTVGIPCLELNRASGPRRLHARGASVQTVGHGISMPSIARCGRFNPLAQDSYGPEL